MSISEEWRNIKYKETYEEEIRGLTRRRQTDTACTVEDLQAILKALYIIDGADWGGRGDVQDTIMAATIAAYEQFIFQWQFETGK
jgi:DNA helicase IV